MNRLSFRSLLSVVATIALSFSLAAPAAGQQEQGANRAKLDRYLQKLHDDAQGGRERVIVRVVPGTRGAVVKSLRAAGATVALEHPVIEAATAEIPLQALAGLSNNPNVRSISVDAPLTPSQAEAPTGRTLLTTLGFSSTTAARGAGVGIAVVDSGIAPSNVFGSRITAFYDFTVGNGKAVAPSDAYGHGTHVAGLAAGSGTPSNGVYPGVASAANLIGLKVLDGYGMGRTSYVISAIEFAIARRATLGIHVVNLSLGHPIYEAASSDPLVQAVEAASRAGLVVVVSAGNFGYNPITGTVGYAGIASPGNAPSAITVGATDTRGTTSRSDDAVAPYSSRGPTWIDGQAKPDIVAPGHALTAVSNAKATLYTQYPAGRVTVTSDKTNVYLRLNGTSMAAGVVSGIVASMIEAHRQSITWTSRPLPPNIVKALLQFSAIPVRDQATGGAYYDVLTQGAGQVNSDGAVELARRIDTSIGVGEYWATSQPAPYSSIGGSSLPWSQHLVWGSHLVWGNTIYFHELGWEATSPWGTLEPNHIVWGNVDSEHLVWGSHLVWGNNIVWGNDMIGAVEGSHIVWGNLAPDADHIVWGNLSSDHLVWGNTESVVGFSATAGTQ